MIGAAKRFNFSKLAILVVEPNARMHPVLRGMLSGFGFTKILLATDSARGAELFAEANPDLALIELVGRDGPDDGLSFVRRIRAEPDPVRASIPILVMSERVTGEQVAAARDAGVNEFLAKPFKADGLLRYLVRIFEQPVEFLQAAGYVGPDRRRMVESFEGPDRRRPRRS